jgi:hypothetical protein
MSNKPQITTHYADGTPSETRDMTDEEIASLPEPSEPPEYA